MSNQPLHPPTAEEIAMICKRGPLSINREILEAVRLYCHDLHSEGYTRTIADGIDIGMRIMQAREAAQQTARAWTREEIAQAYRAMHKIYPVKEPTK